MLEKVENPDLRLTSNTSDGTRAVWLTMCENNKNQVSKFFLSLCVVNWTQK